MANMFNILKFCHEHEQLPKVLSLSLSFAFLSSLSFAYFTNFNVYIIQRPEFYCILKVCS